MTALDAVRPLLPGWVPWVPVVFAGPGIVVLTTLMHAFGEWVCFRGFRKLVREKADAHWTEKAALAWGGRTLLGLGTLFYPLLWAMLAYLFTGPLSFVPAWACAIVAGTSSYFVSFGFSRRIGRQLGFPPRGWVSDLRSTLAMSVLRFALVILVLGATGFMALTSSTSAWFAVPGLAVFALIPLNPQLWLGRAMGLLSDPDDRLQRVVDAAVVQVGRRPKQLWILETSLANAFALPITQGLVITRRALEVLSDDEVQSIVHHELGHLGEGRKAWLRLVPLAGLPLAALTLPSLLRELSNALSLSQPYEPAWGTLCGTLAALITLFVLLLRLRKFNRTAEHDADHTAESAGDPKIYARALERLYEVNLLPGAVKNAIHPSLYDRMTSAGVTPDWPRPAPPPVSSLRVASVSWLLMWLSVLITGVLLPGPNWGIAIGSRAAWAFSDLGYEAGEAQKWHESVLYYQAADHLDPTAWNSSTLAFAQAGDGQCAAAQTSLELTRSRITAAPSIDANEWMDEYLETTKQAIDVCLQQAAGNAPQP